MVSTTVTFQRNVCMNNTSWKISLNENFISKVKIKLFLSLVMHQTIKKYLLLN